MFDFGIRKAFCALENLVDNLAQYQVITSNRITVLENQVKEQQEVIEELKNRVRSLEYELADSFE